MKRTLKKYAPSALKSLASLSENLIPTATCKTIFDPAFYRAANPDVDAAGADPTLHFRRYGLNEGRPPNGWFSESYVRGFLSQESLANENAVSAYARCDLSQKPRLIFVSHDASRTGAPAIILRLLEIFSKSGAFECFTILDAGGERLSEFQALSHTHVMSRSRHDRAFSDQEAFQELEALFDPKGVFQSNFPVCALVNSAESSRIGRHLAALDVPALSLIHEIAAYYKPVVFEDFARLSETVIFPSNFVKNAAERFSDLDCSKVAVRGQGLLEEGFGSLSRADCRQMLREDLNIEEDAFVVLNVGTKDIRKGIDLFVDLAKLFLQNKTLQRPVYFVWYGGTDANFTYAQEFVERHDLKDFVRLMPSTAEIERVFLGGDIFFLTARADPFPCVVHEAMACGLPVIAFRQGGGAPELIGDDCGAIIDMADLNTGCDKIERYLTEPDLFDQHSQNAIDKIARDWGYPAYHSDIYALMRQSISAPQGGWPEITLSQAPSHLVIMQGRLAELDILRDLNGKSDTEISEVALIDGRFGPEIDAVTDRLRQEGWPYKIYQPLEDTEQSRAEIVAQLTRKPRPQQVTLVNALQYLAPRALKQLPYPVSAVQTGNTVSVKDLYLMLPYLDTVLLADRTMADQLAEMNPGFAPHIKGN